MTFKKYNHTNNAFCELLTDLQSSDTTMMLTGNFNRLPTSNFIVKISKYQGTKCVARENIYVANRNNNICTGLVRAYEKVPMDDDATEWIQQALNFSAGDIVECVVSSEILNDLQKNIDFLVKWNSQRTLRGHNQQYWVKFWTLKGEAARLNIKISGGLWFNGNSNSQVGINEIMLQIWSGDHERNCSGFYKADFASDPINAVRVKKISVYEWEIYIYANAWTNGSIVDISYSWEFFEDFRQDISVENESGNNVYNIPKFTKEWVDFSTLQEIHKPTNNSDFLPIKESNGTNKKISVVNLRNWFFPKNGERHQLYDTPKHVPNGCLCTGISYITDSAAWPRGGGWRVLHSTNNSDWVEIYKYQKLSSPQTRVFFVPPGFVKAEYDLDWNRYQGAQVEIQLL